MKINRVKRGTVVAAATTAAISPMAVPVVFPESASAGPGFCDGNNLCLYEDAGFSRSVAWFKGNDNHYGDNTFLDGVTLDNKVSSVWNHTGRWVELCWDPVAVVCDGTGQGGNTLCLGPETAVRNLHLPPGYGDKFSSHAFKNSSGTPYGCDVVVNDGHGCSA